MGGFRALIATLGMVLALVLPDGAALGDDGAMRSTAALAPWRAGDPTFTAPRRTPPIVGVNYHGMWAESSDSARSITLNRLEAAGVPWVRLDIAWATLQPDGPGSYDVAGGVARIEKLLDEIAARGMKTLLVVYWAPKWATGTAAKNGVPRSAAEYGDAVAWAATRWRGKVHAIELWNEPDLDTFLANESVATYTALVKAAYPRIKAVAPETTVVAGAPTYVNTDWYRRFYALGGADSYDALGIHPYLSPSDQPPTACDPKWRAYHPCGIADLVELMKANGDGDKRLWATEYGWSSHDNTQYGGEVPPWKRGVSAGRQADHMLAMHEYLAQWPQVEAAFWYTDRDTARGDAQEDNFGLLRTDLTLKPAYYAMKCAAGGVCGPAAEPGRSREPDGTFEQPDGIFEAPRAAPARVTKTVRRTARATARVRVWSKRLHRHLIAHAKARRSATARARASAATRAAAAELARRRAAARARTKAHARARAAARAKAHRKIREKHHRG